MGPRAYVPVDPEAPAEQRIADATARVPRGGAITGWAALRLHAAAYFDGSLGGVEQPVLVATGSHAGRRRQPGIAWSYELLGESEVQEVQGIRVTRPARALFDAMRAESSWRRAVVAADMEIAAKTVTLDELVTFSATHAGWRRAERVADTLPWVRPGFRSPREALLFLVWRHDAGLPAPLVNKPVFDLEGEFLACPDLFDEEAGLVVEYDGSEHRRIRRHARDVEREDVCRRVGLEYTKVVGPDLDDPARVVDRLRAARGRAQFLPPARRRWTTTWPEDWRPWW